MFLGMHFVEQGKIAQQWASSLWHETEILAVETRALLGAAGRVYLLQLWPVLWWDLQQG